MVSRSRAPHCRAGLGPQLVALPSFPVPHPHRHHVVLAQTLLCALPMIGLSSELFKLQSQVTYTFCNTSVTLYPFITLRD